MSRAEVIQADCLEGMKSLTDASVSAIVTDPPYGQTNEGYDGPIAFGAELWRECHRVARPDAALISFAGSPTYHKIASAIEAGGWQVRQMWGWVYRNGFITSAWPREGFDRLAPAMDPICYATKGKVLLNLEREGSAAWHRNRNADEVCSWSERSGTRAATAVGRWPRSVVAEPETAGFQYFALNPNSPSLRAEKVGHPNQKPVALMRWIVSKLPAGSVVLDPFAGSGSTALACIEEGFDFLGYDISEEYVKIAQSRIDASLAKFPLFGAPG
jgi:site-specific DNA-methyltransferase (adenine-specific)